MSTCRGVSRLLSSSWHSSAFWCSRKGALRHTVLHGRLPFTCKHRGDGVLQIAWPVLHLMEASQGQLQVLAAEGGEKCVSRRQAIAVTCKGMQLDVQTAHALHMRLVVLLELSSHDAM